MALGPAYGGDGTGTGLTEEQEELLNGALVYDDVVWDIGTAYAPNTLVKKTGSETIYLQADTVDSTGDDPASGAPWEVFMEEAEAATVDPFEYTVRFHAVMGTTPPSPASAAAIASGTAAAAQIGNVNVITASTASATLNSGRNFYTATASAVQIGKWVVADFFTPSDLTNIVIRAGWGGVGSFGAAAPGANGSYVSIAGATASLINRSATVDTPHGSTYTVTTGTRYRMRTTRTSATQFLIELMSATNTVLLSATVAGAPSEATAAFPGVQLYYGGTPGGVAVCGSVVMYAGPLATA